MQFSKRISIDELRLPISKLNYMSNHSQQLLQATAGQKL